MYALYRIRCGLPVLVFGETGVGKSALFRFLFSTLLGYDFQVCNVNSGTTIGEVEALVRKSLESLESRPQNQTFLFFDELNTADECVIAFLKELMMDRHFYGKRLPARLHLMVAANPYRVLAEVDQEAAVGLAFQFAKPSPESQEMRNLVYRVNQLPLAFYDHVYDFGHLCQGAEKTYIEEICRFSLSSDFAKEVDALIVALQQCHTEARKLSRDSRSAVSLRDATHAVKIFCWFRKNPAGQLLADSYQITVELAIYLVYAFRFENRQSFLTAVFGEQETATKSMKSASKKIAKILHDSALGSSVAPEIIALNEALCENLFAIFVCVLNGIFVIIVGRPGSSKSLSVEILKAVLSPSNDEMRKKLGGLPSVRELYFQCSPLSTSAGFQSLFQSAQKMSVDPQVMLGMVVLDELGLADLSPEKPIKVLHSALERKSVLTYGETEESSYSVVALSSWTVDAAQVNRGILINRKMSNRKDLWETASELTKSIIIKRFGEGTEQSEDWFKKIKQ